MIIQQRQWTDDELRAAGFTYYERKKQLVMVRMMGEDSKRIRMTLETLEVGKGYVLCYDPGHVVRPNPDDYDHWPVRPDIFKATYRAWDVANWSPSAPEQHLLRLGCSPYYKFTGMWAKLVTEPIRVKSIESSEGVEVPAGMWLAIGTMGEPWYMTEDKLRARYIVP